MSNRNAKRKIKKANISFISLCPAGANNLSTIYKSLSNADDDGKFEFSTVSKMDEEKGILHAIVYAPDTVDSQGDMASKEAVKEMAHSFLKNKGSIDIRHDFKDVGSDKAYVAESFITIKEDATRPEFKDIKDTEDKPVNFDGAWAVTIKVDDPELRKAYKEGTWGGVSMGGKAEFEILSKEITEDGLIEKFKSLLAQVGLIKSNPKQGDDMTDKEIAALVEAGVEKALEPFKAKLASDDKIEKQEIKFEGNPLNPEDIQKHVLKVKALKVDWNDADSVAAYQAEVEKSKASKEDLQKAKLEQLTKEINALRKGSNLPEIDTGVTTQLTKEQQIAKEQEAVRKLIGKK